MITHGAALNRWRLVLGPSAEDAIPLADRQLMRMDDALDFLYGREAGPDVRRDPDGGQEDSHPVVVHWLNEVRELFPRETAEILQRHALDRYQLTELLTDREILEKMEPDEALLETILSLKGMMKGAVLDAARRIVARVVAQLTARMQQEIQRTSLGKLDRTRRSSVHTLQNLDIRRTIRKNLAHYDREQQCLVLEQLYFSGRVRRRNPWHVIIAVDESGSMLSSVIHAAVMAGIFARLPMLTTHLVIFDTAVVDRTDRIDDPVETLMSVQLGGGTDIAKAMAYCQGLMTHPRRTMVVLVSDLCEGGSRQALYHTCHDIVESGARLIALTALNGLPALERAMRRLHGELQGYFSRSAAFRAEGLLRRMSAVWRLARALEAAPEQEALALAGTFRDEYRPAGALRLYLLGLQKVDLAGGVCRHGILFLGDAKAPLLRLSGPAAEILRGQPPVPRPGCRSLGAARDPAPAAELPPGPCRRPGQRRGQSLRHHPVPGHSAAKDFAGSGAPAVGGGRGLLLPAAPQPARPGRAGAAGAAVAPPGRGAGIRPGGTALFPAAAGRRGPGRMAHRPLPGGKAGDDGVSGAAVRPLAAGSRPAAGFLRGAFPGKGPAVPVPHRMFHQLGGDAMNHCLDAMEACLTDLLQTGLDTGAGACAAGFAGLAAQCEACGLHTGGALMERLAGLLEARAHTLHKQDDRLLEVMFQAEHYIALCRERCQELEILRAWQEQQAQEAEKEERGDLT